MKPLEKNSKASVCKCDQLNVQFDLRAITHAK